MNQQTHRYTINDRVKKKDNPGQEGTVYSTPLNRPDCPQDRYIVNWDGGKIQPANEADIEPCHEQQLTGRSYDA